MLKNITAFLAIATVGAIAGAADAQILASDSFDYVGALTDNGWAAHSGAGNKVIMADGAIATLEQSGGDSQPADGVT